MHRYRCLLFYNRIFLGLEAFREYHDGHIILSARRTIRPELIGRGSHREIGGTEMSEVFDGPPTLNLALERYKRGKCPCCGKSQGEPKGLEYRTRSNDLYCHTCKQSWPTTLNYSDLQSELSLSLPSVPDSLPRQVFDKTPHCKTAGFQTDTRGLRRLLKRIVLRR